MHDDICFDIYTAQDLITLITAVQLQCVCTMRFKEIPCKDSLSAQIIISKISNDCMGGLTHAFLQRGKKETCLLLIEGPL